MPKKIGTLLQELAAKAGVDLKDAKYADLLSIATEAPDDFVTAVESNLFNFDSAKNNAELDKIFRARALNGVDSKIKAVAEESGLTADEIAEINAEKNSYEKIALLNSKVKAKLESAHAGKSGDGKKLADEITKLNNDILGIKKSHTDELSRIKAESEDAILNYAFDSHLGSLQYANGDIPQDVNILTAKNLVSKALGDKKAKLVRGADGKLTLKNSDNPELDYFENNKPVSFSDLTNSVLANNKLLKVSGEPAQQPPRNIQFKPADGKGQDTSNITSAIDAQLAQLGVK